MIWSQLNDSKYSYVSLKIQLDSHLFLVKWSKGSVSNNSV